VHKAVETEVGRHEQLAADQRINRFLQFLHDHFETVHWQRVPYAHSVRKYLQNVRENRAQELIGLHVEFGRERPEEASADQASSPSSKSPHPLNIKIIQSTSYLDDERIRRAHSKSILDSEVKISTQLHKRLDQLLNLIDFNYAYLNKKVGEIPEGKEFGELALI
jgi:hypothetical protein